MGKGRGKGGEGWWEGRGMLKIILRKSTLFEENNKNMRKFYGVPSRGGKCIGNFFGIPENIQDSVAEEENVKQILTKVK